MAEGSRPKAPTRKTAKKERSKPAGGKGGKTGNARSKVASRKSAARKTSPAHDDHSLIDRLTKLADGLTGDLAAGALRLAARVGNVPLQALLGEPANPNMAREAGESLRELRELAGLTRRELAEAIQLSDTSLLQAVENGTAALSFELILRLASILARHDPVPFVARYTRTYSPEFWRVLEDWGVGRLPVQFEREREFINIYRRHDAARKLSDEGFEKVRDFTRAAFEMSLHFVAELEEVDDAEIEPED